MDLSLSVFIPWDKAVIWLKLSENFFVIIDGIVSHFKQSHPTKVNKPWINQHINWDQLVKNPHSTTHATNSSNATSVFAKAIDQQTNAIQIYLCTENLMTYE